MSNNCPVTCGGHVVYRCQQCFWCCRFSSLQSSETMKPLVVGRVRYKYVQSYFRSRRNILTTEQIPYPKAFPKRISPSIMCIIKKNKRQTCLYLFYHSSCKRILVPNLCFKHDYFSMSFFLDCYQVFPAAQLTARLHPWERTDSSENSARVPGTNLISIMGMRLRIQAQKRNAFVLDSEQTQRFLSRPNDQLSTWKHFSLSSVAFLHCHLREVFNRYGHARLHQVGCHP